MKYSLLTIKRNLASLITSTFTPQLITDEFRKQVDKFFLVVGSLIKNRGLREAISYVKRTRLIVTRNLSGSKLERLDGVRIKGGWPVWISNLQYLTQSIDGLKILLTLLNVLKYDQLPPNPNITPITDKYQGSIPYIKGSFHKMICNWLGISRRNIFWKNFHLSTKKGPNGQALVTSIFDLFALPPELYNDIAYFGGNSPLRSHMDELTQARWDNLTMVDIWKHYLKIEKPKQEFRRLSYFGDKEGKTRVIAIMDYWSQTCLKPLHDTLNSILKKIPADCTFNQNHFLTWLPDQGPYYSFDLTNATDRMPIDLQCRLIGVLMGRGKAEAWKRILVKYPYSITMPNREHISVSYQAGQPMGAYSSWPAMALTHHYLVQWSAVNAGHRKYFSKYCLLGDDIVIADALVAEEYQKLLKYLDIPISEAKTHNSQELYEFAKRWVYRGVEITPFALGGILECWKRYPYLHNILETQHQHGWVLNIDRHPDLIRSIYRLMGKPQQSERVIKLYMVFQVLAKAKKTRVFNGDIYKMSTQYFGFPTYDEPREREIEQLSFQAIISELLGTDLGCAQTELWELLTEVNKTILELVPHNPGLFGQVYRDWAREHVPFSRILEEGDEDHPIDRIVMALYCPEPKVDELWAYTELKSLHVGKGIFSMRQSHIRLGQIARIVKLLITKMKELATNPTG